MPKLFVKPYSQDELDPSKMGVYAFEITPVYFKGISDAPAQHQIGWYFYTGFKKTYWDYGDINHDNPQISVYIKGTSINSKRQLFPPRLSSQRQRFQPQHRFDVEAFL